MDRRFRGVWRPSVDGFAGDGESAPNVETSFRGAKGDIRAARHGVTRLL
jgi:hypothetical protein